MTKNKDLKRLVRARMTKTGESYTSARANLTRTAKSGTTSSDAEARPLEDGAGWPALAGQSDQVMRAKTGRTWAEWVAALDAYGASARTHTEIARYVRDELGVDGWWAQTVTVGYERIRGLRAPNQRRGGGFEASKSKTLPVSVSTLYASFAQKRRRDRWLGGVALTVRTSIVDKSLRITWPDGTNVEVHVASKGPAKSTATIVHSKLASAAAVAEAKAYWAERLAALAEMLKPG